MRLREIFLAILLLSGVQGCAALARGPFAPDELAQARARDEYVALVNNYVVKDSAFEIRRLGSSLIVTALYCSPELQAAAAKRWPDDPAYQRGVLGWSGRTTFLIGVFSENFQADDLMKDGRFRPLLQVADGRELAPAALKRYGRTDQFVTDYFPVFSPWDQVFLVQFETGAEPRAFLLKWPGGVRRLKLPAAPTAFSAAGAEDIF